MLDADGPGLTCRRIPQHDGDRGVLFTGIGCNTYRPPGMQLGIRYDTDVPGSAIDLPLSRRSSQLILSEIIRKQQLFRGQRIRPRHNG